MQSRLTLKQIHDYLHTLQIPPNETPDLTTLNALVYAHQTSIPFSSVDVYHCQSAPSLEIDDVFNKVVTKKRGGYCFEMNLIFKELLLALGYDSYPIFCRINRPNCGRLSITHQGTLTTIDGMRYYTDIGFGGPVAAGALALDNKVEQTIQDETYRMCVIDESWWALERLGSQLTEKPTTAGDDTWIKVLELCTAKVENQDFLPLSAFCSQPGARFYETTILNLRTASGNYAMDDFTLTIRESGNKRVIDLSDEAAQSDAIEQYFGFKR